jgi:hypothetical protein
MTMLSLLPKRILGFLSALLLAGCATHYDELANAMPPLAPDEGRIILYTPVSNVGTSAVDARIRINNRAVGRAQPGSFFYVDRPAGTYSLVAHRGRETPLKFDLKAGQIQYVRFATDVLGATNSGPMGPARLRPELAPSADQAQAELQPLRYWGASSRTRKEQGVGRDGRSVM